MRRIIREEEPPRPSTRLSTLGETLSAVSAQRKTEPGKLSALVRGDLDWIVMKALEKDRTRRYETASDFGRMCSAYLRDEPVIAGPPLDLSATKICPSPSQGCQVRRCAPRSCLRQWMVVPGAMEEKLF